MDKHSFEFSDDRFYGVVDGDARPVDFLPVGAVKHGEFRAAEDDGGQAEMPDERDELVAVAVAKRVLLDALNERAYRGERALVRQWGGVMRRRYGANTDW